MILIALRKAFDRNRFLLGHEVATIDRRYLYCGVSVVRIISLGLSVNHMNVSEIAFQQCYELPYEESDLLDEHVFVDISDFIYSELVGYFS